MEKNVCQELGEAAAAVEAARRDFYCGPVSRVEKFSDGQMRTYHKTLQEFRLNELSGRSEGSYVM
jgi:hypothetical protein